VGGFGQAKWAKGKDYLLDGTHLREAQGRILKTLNDADLQALCVKVSVRKAQGWRALAVDGDGLVAARFVKGGQKGAPLRVNFDTPAGDARGWRARFQTAFKRLLVPANGRS
jgi:hypothetical protein